MNHQGRGGMEDFLDRFRIESGKLPTHTRFGGSFGSYYIPVIDNDRFFRVYARYIASRKFSQHYNGKASIGLVERHRDYGPVVIDLDFRHEPDINSIGSEPKRLYTRLNIDNFIRKYLAAANDWVSFPDELNIIILEKPQARQEKGIVKDGVHIVIPELVAHTRVQHLIRRDVIELCKRVNPFDGMSLCNTLENVFDEAVIKRNGWMMYGSGKEDDTCYEITRKICVTNKFGTFDIQFYDVIPPSDEIEVLEIIEYLSIRNKDESLAAAICPNKVAEIEREMRVEELSKHIIKRARLADHETHRVYATTDDYELAKKLVRILDDDRADEYDTWIKTGFCLHNIDDRLLPEWVEFSKRSSKFETGLCENLWSHMPRPEKALGMGSLRMWSKQDNPGLYDKVIKDCVSGRVQAAISGLHHDIAMVVKGLYTTRFVCTSIRNGTWHEYVGHRWRLCDSGFSLRKMLSVDVYNRFIDEAMKCSNEAQRITADQSAEDNSSVAVKHSVLTEQYKKLNQVAAQLKNSAFKDAIMRECKELFFQEGFESSLDTIPNLVGFENGVYDLITHEFREGCPEDMISFSVRYDYVPYDSGSEHVIDIMSFFEKVMPESAVREYLIRLMGSYLNGDIREERFHMWTGSGANGKSVTVKLFDECFGDYACKLPVALLTQKRAASNAASSEIARLKGRRFATLQEPSHDETLNVGLMKELTGGDRIMARQLYREPVEFQPYVRLSLICNNLPAIPSTDGGTWRRIRKLDFPSKFTDNPDPQNPREFKIDKSIEGKLTTWAPYMMAILIQYYKTYIEKGNPEPEEVMRATRLYQQSQDSVQLFITNTIEFDDDDHICIPEVHSMYKDFLNEMSIKGVTQKRLDFVRDLERLTGLKAVGNGPNQKISGLKLKTLQPDDDA